MNYSSNVFSIPKKHPIAHPNFCGRTYSIGLQYIGDETLILPEQYVHIPWSGGKMELRYPTKKNAQSTVEELAALRIISSHMIGAKPFIYVSEDCLQQSGYHGDGLHGKNIYTSYNFGERTADAIEAITDCVTRLFWVASYKSAKSKNEQCDMIINNLRNFVFKWSYSVEAVEDIEHIVNIMWFLFNSCCAENDCREYFEKQVESKLIKSWQVGITNTTPLEVFFNGEVLEYDGSIALYHKKHSDFLDSVLPSDHPQNLRFFPYNKQGLTNLGNIIIQNIDDEEYVDAAKTALQYVRLDEFAEAMIADFKQSSYGYDTTSFYFGKESTKDKTVVSKEQLQYIAVDLNAIS